MSPRGPRGRWLTHSPPSIPNPVLASACEPVRARCRASLLSSVAEHRGETLEAASSQSVDFIVHVRFRAAYVET